MLIWKSCCGQKNAIRYILTYEHDNILIHICLYKYMYKYICTGVEKMKYTIHGFSQKMAIEMGLKIDDLLLLRWFVDFMGTNRMKKFFVEDECFYWVRYDSILEDLPILDCKKRAVASKLKNLVDTDVLKNQTLKRGGTYSVYAIGENYGSLVSDTGGCCSNDNGVAVETTTGLLLEQQGVAVETTTGCCSNDNGVAVQTTTKDLITIYPSINPSTKTHIEKNECVSVEKIYTAEQEIFDYWNSKEGVTKSQEKSFNQNKISTAVKKHGKENILKAIDRVNDAVLSADYYYAFKWNLYRFLTQSNGISNWLDDGQLWNDFNSRGKSENKKPAVKKNGFGNYEQRSSDYYDTYAKLERQRINDNFDPDKFEKLSNGIGRNIDEIS